MKYNNNNGVKMKKIFLLCSLLVIVSSCKTMDDNINARKNLSKCKYEFEKIEVTNIKLKGLIIRYVDFNIYLKITNTTNNDVALDRIEGKIFLDKHKTSNFKHKKFIRIKPGKSAIEPVTTRVIFPSVVKSIGKRPKNIIIKAKAYVSLLVGSGNLKTPVAIEVQKKFPIPYNKIDKEIKKRSKKILIRKER